MVVELTHVLNILIRDTKMLFVRLAFIAMSLLILANTIVLVVSMGKWLLLVALALVVLCLAGYAIVTIDEIKKVYYSLNNRFEVKRR